MSKSLNTIQIEGFKSIKSLNLKMEKMNVLVGANGSGKSNFIHFFKMLSQMAQGNLQGFITKNAGSMGYFFEGPKKTPIFKSTMIFGSNGYRFEASSTVDQKILIDSEETYYEWRGSKWQIENKGVLESGLKDWDSRKSPYNDGPGVQFYVEKAIKGWTFYHFHDTSERSELRLPSKVYDNRMLRSYGDNLASVLWKMRENTPQAYARIIITVQMVAPFFEDFILEPEKSSNDEQITLQWKQKGSDFPFQIFHLSDGTLRFIALVTALFQPTLPTTILIDEPELGLHPYALHILSQLLWEVSDRTQIIISTQSSTLMSHFHPEDLIIVDRFEGASRFRRLENEDYEAWLEEYNLGDLVEKNVIEAGPK